MPIISLSENKSAPIPNKVESVKALELDTVVVVYGATTITNFEKHYPDISFIYGLGSLKEAIIEARASGKRFWALINGEVEFFDNQAIWSALVCMMNYGLGAVGLFSTNDKNKSKAGLKFTETGWVPGYFMLVDSQRVGDVGLPDGVPDDAMDITYSMEIKAMGYAVGIAPGVVYRESHSSVGSLSVMSNDWLVQRYGDFYIHNANQEPTL